MTPALPSRILVTGSEGLIGRVMRARLTRAGVEVRGLDLNAEDDERGDITLRSDLERALSGVDGIIHLAAVSRVVWGERDPDRCYCVNVEGTRQVLQSALRARRAPWVIIASSREVYGNPDRLPATESTPLQPINTYAHTKVAGERAAEEAAAAGLRVGVMRFSNVYGRTQDHADRVVPAFARAAALGGRLRIEGSDHLFDFTHVDDVVDGIERYAGLRNADPYPSIPTLHLVSGTATTLGQLACLARAAALRSVECVEAPPRTFDVHRFVGDPARAASLLGWRPTIHLSTGFARLVSDFNDLRVSNPSPGPAHAPHP